MSCGHGFDSCLRMVTIVSRRYGVRVALLTFTQADWLRLPVALGVMACVVEWCNAGLVNLKREFDPCHKQHTMQVVLAQR